MRHPDSPPRTACAVCGLVLNYSLSPSGLAEWHHISEVDHLAVPTPVDTIQTNFRCDFCLADNAQWVLPVEPYQVMPGHMNDGDWACCTDCATNLRDGNWNALTTRALDAFITRNKVRMPRSHFTDLYKTLRQHIQGEVRLRL